VKETGKRCGIRAKEACKKLVKFNKDSLRSCFFLGGEETEAALRRFKSNPNSNQLVRFLSNLNRV
jgi:hypothetical protein